MDGRGARRSTDPSVQSKPGIRQHIRMTTILLLTLSNIFMTFAWYGHLKYRHAPLFKVIVISWLIAFAEYCFQVPANRIGSYAFTTAQFEDHTGGHHPNRIFDLLGLISSRTAEVELPRGFRHDDRRRGGDFQEVVKQADARGSSYNGLHAKRIQARRQ
jgi:hypothetical protein